MMFYRLAVKRLIEYFQLDQLYKEDERRYQLRHKKKKADPKLVLLADQTLNFYVSVILSILCMLVCFSIPYAALESPSEIFQEKEMYSLYEISKVVEEYSILLDFAIIITTIVLIVVSINTVMDAIHYTNINISPWILRGKYDMPPDMKRRLHGKYRNCNYDI